MITKKDVEECIRHLEQESERDTGEYSKFRENEVYNDKEQTENMGQSEGRADAFREAASYLKSHLLPKAKKTERTEERLNEA